MILVQSDYVGQKFDYVSSKVPLVFRTLSFLFSSFLREMALSNK